MERSRDIIHIAMAVQVPTIMLCSCGQPHTTLLTLTTFHDPAHIDELLPLLTLTSLRDLARIDELLPLLAWMSFHFLARNVQ